MANSFFWSGLVALSILVGLPVAAQEAVTPKVKMLRIGEGGTLNLDSRERVAALFDRCVQAGINTVALEVKPPSGVLLFDSAIASRSASPYPASFDLLKVASEEAAPRHLKLQAAVSLFYEGVKKDLLGPAFDHPKWAAVVFDQTSVASLDGRELRVRRNADQVEGGISLIVPSEKIFEAKKDGVLALINNNRVSVLFENSLGARFPVPKDAFLLQGDPASSEAMRGLRLGDAVELKHRKQIVSELQYPSGKNLRVNPNLPEIQERLLEILKQLAAYPIDGILVENAGFGGLKTDFSDTSRRMFEAFLGHEVVNWPTDVIDYGSSGELQPGPAFKSWQEWRCKSQQNFLERAKKTIKAADPKKSFGLLEDETYADSLESGLNWEGLSGVLDAFVSTGQDNAKTDFLRQKLGNLSLVLGLSEPSGWTQAIAPRLKEAEGVVIPLELLNDTNSWSRLKEALRE